MNNTNDDRSASKNSANVSSYITSNRNTSNFYVLEIYIDNTFLLWGKCRDILHQRDAFQTKLYSPASPGPTSRERLGRATSSRGGGLVHGAFEVVSTQRKLNQNDIVHFDIAEARLLELAIATREPPVKALRPRIHLKHD